MFDIQVGYDKGFSLLCKLINKPLKKPYIAISQAVVKESDVRNFFTDYAEISKKIAFYLHFNVDECNLVGVPTLKQKVNAEGLCVSFCYPRLCLQTKVTYDPKAGKNTIYVRSTYHFHVTLVLCYSTRECLLLSSRSTLCLGLATLSLLLFFLKQRTTSTLQIFLIGMVLQPHICMYVSVDL